MYVLLFALLCVAGSSAYTKNVCPTWQDYWTTRFNKRCAYNNDQFIEILEIAKKYGFPLVEVHNVTTEDGYILQLYRISAENASARAVLVVHGIYQNAFSWFSQGNNSLAYVLASSRRLDVWVVNLRGTKYSSRRTDGVTSGPAFWDFSIHELGTKDYRAIVKYVYGVSKTGKLLSVSFSMGNTAAMIYASTFPAESQTYLERVVALAPVGYLRQNTSILGYLQYLWTPCRWFLKLFGIGSVMKPNKIMPQLLFLMTPIHMRFYRFVMGLVFGFDPAQFNPWTLPILVTRSGDSIGVNIIEHYVQIIRRNVFAAMDYGSKKLNVAHYGSKTPPLYNLTGILVPFTFVYGQNDALATPANVRHTFRELPTQNNNCLIKVDYQLCNHQDFVMAKDAYGILYKPLVESWLQGTCPSRAA